MQMSECLSRYDKPQPVLATPVSPKVHLLPNHAAFLYVMKGGREGGSEGEGGTVFFSGAWAVRSQEKNLGRTDSFIEHDPIHDPIPYGSVVVPLPTKPEDPHALNWTNQARVIGDLVEGLHVSLVHLLCEVYWAPWHGTGR